MFRRREPSRFIWPSEVPEWTYERAMEVIERVDQLEKTVIPQDLRSLTPKYSDSENRKWWYRFECLPREYREMITDDADNPNTAHSLSTMEQLWWDDLAKMELAKKVIATHKKKAHADKAYAKQLEQKQAKQAKEAEERRRRGISPTDRERPREPSGPGYQREMNRMNTMRRHSAIHGYQTGPRLLKVRRWNIKDGFSIVQITRDEYNRLKELGVPVEPAAKTTYILDNGRRRERTVMDDLKRLTSVPDDTIIRNRKSN